jgi:valyl-tRNA synthetase
LKAALTKYNNSYSVELPKKYQPAETEQKWYDKWLEKGFFKSVPDDREPYTIVIPPPNVTGVLHMGHMLNNTLQDVLIRRARMQGKNACWVPGTDHASIATEAKVVAMLREKGIHKRDLTREQFLDYAWEWNHKYGGIILEQLKKLGASCDWDRTRFTMEDSLYDAVIDTFIDLYNKGLIYRGKRMVNWDPAGMTAVSDEEVIYKETDSKLYYVKYKIEGSNNEYVTVATTRPETILGDSALCVNPDDERYTSLHGKRVIVPLVNRSIPVITDSYVTMDFGTGALKVTPAHDLNDYELGVKHNLETIDILTPNGKLSDNAQFFIGMDRFDARDAIAKKLSDEGILIKTENYKSNVGYSERTNAVIEPRLSLQWFMKMKELSIPALDAVMNDEVKLIPVKFKNTYRHWMENVRDWCISRQLWWGQRIPAWYCKSGEVVVAKTEQEAKVKFEELKKQQVNEGEKEIDISAIHQDEDVMDTWFSSWLWPISVFDGIKNPDNPDIKYYYPTNDIVTAPEILFFWVARMIMAGYEYRGEKPFENVYLTGIVRDMQGRKMSKSLGNSPEPLELIKKHGADGVRVGMLLSSPAGNDLLFDEALCEQGRNFSNKIWNAFRLINSWEDSLNTGEVDSTDRTIAVRWMENRIDKELSLINDHFSKYRISDALMATYKLVWNDFCSWYLEMVKPTYGMTIDPGLLVETKNLFKKLLKILHPFMPFITEEIWHTINKDADDFIIVAPWPEANNTDTAILDECELFQKIVTELRTIRKSANIPMKQKIEVSYIPGAGANAESFHSLIEKLCNVGTLTQVDQSPAETVSIIAGNHEYFAHTLDFIDKESEIKKIETELLNAKNLLRSVMKKLGNEKFVNNAKPEVVTYEKKKKSDAESKIKILEKNLSGLKN